MLGWTAHRMPARRKHGWQRRPALGQKQRVMSPGQPVLHAVRPHVLLLVCLAHARRAAPWGKGPLPFPRHTLLHPAGRPPHKLAWHAAGVCTFLEGEARRNTTQP